MMKVNKPSQRSKASDLISDMPIINSATLVIPWFLECPVWITQQSASPDGQLNIDYCFMKVRSHLVTEIRPPAGAESRIYLRNEDSSDMADC